MQSQLILKGLRQHAFGLATYELLSTVALQFASVPGSYLRTGETVTEKSRKKLVEVVCECLLLFNFLCFIFPAFSHAFFISSLSDFLAFAISFSLSTNKA